jgi:hypothetical protein
MRLAAATLRGIFATLCILSVFACRAACFEVDTHIHGACGA